MQSKPAAPLWWRGCATLSEAGQRHPAYKRALTLLNDTFRRSKLAQRLAVLQSAACLINVLEHAHRDQLIDAHTLPGYVRRSRAADFP